MAERALRGSRLGAVSYENDKGTELAERQMILYICPNRHRLEVPLSGGPAFALTWILKVWHDALPPATAQQFANMRVADLAVDPNTLLDQPFVKELPEATNVELASLNVLVGKKRG